MNSVWVFQHELSGKNVHPITDERLTHFLQTLKPSIGQRIQGCVLNQENCYFKVLELNRKNVILEYDGIREVAGMDVAIELIVGLSRPQTVKKVLEYGATMGVTKFTFVRTSLSEKSYEDAKLFQNSEFEKHLIHGISQSARYFKLPEVQVLKSFKQIILEAANLKLLCNLSPASDAMAVWPVHDKLVVAIGPERGWSTEELNFFEENQFLSINLYPSVLRVEAAVISALTQYSLKVK